MAKVERIQELVVDVAERVPDTDNVRVYEDLADVALALPPRLAARLAPKLARALALPHQILLPEKLGTLVVHLAKAGEHKSAFDVATQLFQVLPDEREATTGTEQEESLPLPEARPRFDPWRYRRILSQAVPALATAAGFDSLAFFSGLLDRLLEDADGEAPEAPIVEETSDGVRIMTAHRAKGLEFPVVILADVTANLTARGAWRSEAVGITLREAGDRCDRRGSAYATSVAPVSDAS
jgi:superfamily I DNA/RNA helicase